MEERLVRLFGRSKESDKATDQALERTRRSFFGRVGELLRSSDVNDELWDSLEEVLIGADAFAELGLNMSLTTLAQLAILGAAISYGCASVFGRRFKSLGVSPFSTAVGQVTAATIILLPMSYIVERPDQLANPSLVTGLALVCLGVFCTALGYLLYFQILSSSGATNVVLVTFLVPVTAAFLGWLILGEQLHGRYFIGMMLIGLGLAAIDGRPWEKLRAVLR